MIRGRKEAYGSIPKIENWINLLLKQNGQDELICNKIIRSDLIKIYKKMLADTVPHRKIKENCHTRKG